MNAPHSRDMKGKNKFSVYEDALQVLEVKITGICKQGSFQESPWTISPNV